jgi:hypothetical protein
MSLARLLIFCSLVVSALLIAGCQPKSTALNVVTGKVLYKGVPLTSGIIVFSPDTSRGETGKVAFSKIESDGAYSLKTGDAPGVMSGWYRVAVVSLANPTANYDTAPISYLPDKYRVPEQSQLQCEVKPNRDNHLDFNLD